MEINVLSVDSVHEIPEGYTGVVFARVTESVRYYKNGLYHREDGPAIEYRDTSKHWWVNGERHRLDGPAIEYCNGMKQWWYQGRCYTPEEHFELALLEAKTEDEKMGLLFNIHRWK